VAISRSSAIRTEPTVILGIGGYLPQRVVTNEELVANFPEITAEYVYQVTGIRRGWRGLLHYNPDDAESLERCTIQLNRSVVRTIDRSGGTFLHTSRTNPAAVRANEIPEFLRTPEDQSTDEKQDFTGGHVAKQTEGETDVAHKLAEAFQQPDENIDRPHENIYNAVKQPPTPPLKQPHHTPEERPEKSITILCSHAETNLLREFVLRDTCPGKHIKSFLFNAPLLINLKTTLSAINERKGSIKSSAKEGRPSFGE
jgi:hypothetical protein